MMPKTPLVSRKALADTGFKFVTYNVALPAAIQAMQDVFAALAADEMDRAPPLAPFSEVTRVIGLPDYNAIEARYAAAD